MSLSYRFAYAFGFTPWERDEGGFRQELIPLLDDIEKDRDKPYGKALDIGSGTGRHSIGLATRGWETTGVENVDKALAEARDRPGADQVTFVKGDATKLEEAVEPGFDLLLDIGCFHGLKPEQCVEYGRGATAVASFDAVLVMFAFQPGRLRGPLPRGVTREELLAAFPGWRLEHEQPADMSGMPRNLKNTHPRWYRLARGQP